METFRQLFNSDAIAIFALLKKEMEPEIESFFPCLLCVTDTVVRGQGWMKIMSLESES